MKNIPASQFALYEVEAFIGNTRIYSSDTKYQTFGEAYAVVSKMAKGTDLIEMPKNNPFQVEYAQPEFKVNKYTKKITCKTTRYIIRSFLFTYDETKPLVTNNFLWKEEDENYKESKVM